LDDPTVDVVHVTSPNDLHLPQARAALAAGRHVVCEKPLAMSANESRELVDLAEASRLVNAANFNIRYYPLNQHAHDVVSGGDIGDVRLVTGRYFQDWLLLESDWNWRLQPERGGALRAVGDIGSHWLDLTAFITGQRIVAVMADLATFVEARREPTGPVETYSTDIAMETVTREIATEDTATILLRFENGARGALSVSQISAGRKNSLQYEIDGSVASVAWDSEQPDQLWLGHRERPTEILIKNPALMGSRWSGGSGPAGRTCRGLRRYVRRALSGDLRGRRRGRPVGPARLSHVRRWPRRNARQRRDRAERPTRPLGRGAARAGGRGDRRGGVMPR
jgi:predicted dehydrogenase